MATKQVPPLKSEILEGIANAIGDTNEGLTGTEIHRLLQQAQIEDMTGQYGNLSKRKNLFNSFAEFQNTHKCSNNILTFITIVLAPARFVNNEEKFDALRTKVNQQLAFAGYEIGENGKIHFVESQCYF